MRILAVITFLLVSNSFCQEIRADDSVAAQPTVRGIARAKPSPREGDVLVSISGLPAKKIFEALTGPGVSESASSSETLTLTQRNGIGISCEESKKTTRRPGKAHYRCVMQVTADGETIGFGTDPGGMVGNFE